jgi:6-pyruvoyltetrahydropterin/6-carboxytetrahydropterin synthase
MFEVSAEQTFAAGHALRGYQGKCENVHGHNYRVRVTLAGEQLNSIGLLVDFVDMKRLMKEIIEYLDHKFINDLPPFDKVNPTAENMAQWFCEQFQKGLDDGLAQVPARVTEVVIWETEKNIATYRP